MPCLCGRKLAVSDHLYWARRTPQRGKDRKILRDIQQLSVILVRVSAYFLCRRWRCRALLCSSGSPEIAKLFFLVNIALYRNGKFGNGFRIKYSESKLFRAVFVWRQPESNPFYAVSAWQQSELELFCAVSKWKQHASKPFEAFSAWK